MQDLKKTGVTVKCLHGLLAFNVFRNLRNLVINSVLDAYYSIKEFKTTVFFIFFGRTLHFSCYKILFTVCMVVL